MDKIYRRPTQISSRPKKKKNEKNRKRNTFINFRVTPIERELIEARISVTGLPKARFYIESCLYQTILVRGNIKSFTAIKDKLEEIAEKIDKNPKLEDLDPDHAEALKTILEIVDKRFDEKHITDSERG